MVLGDNGYKVSKLDIGRLRQKCLGFCFNTVDIESGEE